MDLMPAEGQEPRRIIILHNPQWEIQSSLEPLHGPINPFRVKVNV